MPNVQNVAGVSRVVPNLPNVPNISVCTSSQSSRQNLDSIVEAIRHLEGDHLFSEDRHQVSQLTVFLSRWQPNKYTKLMQK